MIKADSVVEAKDDLTLTIVRNYPVPPRILFEAWSKCEHIKQWFGPVGWPVTFCEMDFRVGGKYRFAMTGPSGELNTPFGGTYLEIVPDQKIVYDDAFEVAGAELMIVTALFDASTTGTTLTIVNKFASPAMWESHVGGGIAEGYGSALDQLGEVVSALHKSEQS